MSSQQPQASTADRGQKRTRGAGEQQDPQAATKSAKIDNPQPKRLTLPEIEATYWLAVRQVKIKTLCELREDCIDTLGSILPAMAQLEAVSSPEEKTEILEYIREELLSRSRHSLLVKYDQEICRPAYHDLFSPTMVWVLSNHCPEVMDEVQIQHRCLQAQYQSDIIRAQQNVERLMQAEEDISEQLGEKGVSEVNFRDLEAERDRIVDQLVESEQELATFQHILAQEFEKILKSIWGSNREIAIKVHYKRVQVIHMLLNEAFHYINNKAAELQWFLDTQNNG